MIWGYKEQVIEEKSYFLKMFDCEDIGQLTENMGQKFEINNSDSYIRFTQSVMIQSSADEF